MKIRNGYVSNSSSSSFIVYDKENQERVIELIKQYGYYDYYIYKDVLYTSFICDCCNLYAEIGRFCNDEEYIDYIEGGHGGPYCEDDFICLKGELNGCDIWISNQKIDKEDYEKLGVTESILRKLVEEFISHYNSDYLDEYKECLSSRIIEFIFKAKELLYENNSIS